MFRREIVADMDMEGLEAIGNLAEEVKALRRVIAAAGLLQTSSSEFIDERAAALAYLRKAARLNSEGQGHER